MTATASSAEGSARYRFGAASRTGVLLGLGMRQSAPLVAGCVWLTGWLMAQLPLVGLAGPLIGLVVSFGRWRRTPLYEVAAPGVRLAVRRRSRRATWVRRSLTAAGPGAGGDLPAPLRGLELCDVDVGWDGANRAAGVVRDRR